MFPAGREVTLSPFYMGKYEVTQAQYKSVMEGQKVTVGGTEYTLADSPSLCVQGSTDYKIDSDKDHANYPVENVTWFDAVYYCNALSAKEGLQPCYKITVTTVSSGHITSATVEYDKAKNGYRLPTEAAHAGDAGRGFSVVAEEIRKLADSSSKEAKKIDEVLGGIKKLIEGAFDKTNTTQKEIEHIVDLFETVNNQEQVVKNAVSEQADGGKLLLSSLQQMKNNANSVSDAVENLKKTTSIIQDSIRQMGGKNTE